MKKIITHEQMLAALKKACDKESQAAFARKADVPRQLITDVLKGRKGPTPRLLEALKLRRVVYFEKVED